MFTDPKVRFSVDHMLIKMCSTYSLTVGIIRKAVALVLLGNCNYVLVCLLGGHWLEQCDSGLGMYFLLVGVTLRTKNNWRSIETNLTHCFVRPIVPVDFCYHFIE